MPEQAQLLDAGFSTADAAYPSFAWHGARLDLEFRDWQERAVRVAFDNPAGVSWQELDSSGPEDRDDSVYEIADSEWIAAYLRAGSHTPGDGLRHFKLCFNAWGVFEVLATTMRLSAG
jgi:hypothetical protein